MNLANNITQQRLIMTLLVRNEVDVIEGNIRFHLDHGVDFIVAMDNGSSDGTTEILEKYARMEVLHLIHEPSRIFQQQLWVNNMGELACEVFSANMIFHSDADELWHPSSGSLKLELVLKQQVDVLSIPVKNMLLSNKNGGEQFPCDVAYEVSNPINKPTRKVMDEVSWRSFFLYHYPNKVFYRTHKGYLKVVQGNHNIIPDKPWPPVTRQLSTDIEVLHFPIRGLEQFRQKVINNGEGLQNLDLNFGSDSIHAWHVKRWYALFKQGRFHEEYSRLLDLEAYLEEGILKPLCMKRKRLLDYFHKESHYGKASTHIFFDQT